MFGVGITEMIIVAFIGLLLFGNRLPEVARSMGLSITEFKKGARGIEDDIRQRPT
jgi:sec-independent protein translocase protein TatA